MWCSPACRSAASIERKAAERDGGAVQVVVVPRPPTPREDANAVAGLLSELTENLEKGRQLPRPVRQAIDALATAVLRESAEPWQFHIVVPPAVRRERAKARERMKKLRARRAAEAPPKPAQAPPPPPTPPPPPPPPRRVDVDAVELFIDAATSRIQARDLDDDLLATYQKLTAASGRMVEAVQRLREDAVKQRPPTVPPPPAAMNRAQRRQAQRRDDRNV